MTRQVRTLRPARTPSLTIYPRQEAAKHASPADAVCITACKTVPTYPSQSWRLPMVQSPSVMTATDPTPHYALGSTDAEHERLIWQPARLAPLTEQLFREAGIAPGQRVLDIGSGVGDVAMLAAQLGRPSGAVLGTE